MLTDGLEWCGLLWCFYQLFGLWFWRHPFTAEHPLVSKWCNVTFLQIWCRNKLIYILGGPRVRKYSAKFNYWVNYTTYYMKGNLNVKNRGNKHAQLTLATVFSRSKKYIVEKRGNWQDRAGFKEIKSINTMLWLFNVSGQIAVLPQFKQFAYLLKAQNKHTTFHV